MQATSPAVGDAVMLGPFDVPGCTLLAGTNVLAAEVHQIGFISSDIVFGLELTATIPSEVTGPGPELNILRWGNQTILSWRAPGAVIESASSVTGSWSAATSSMTTFIVPPTNTSMFFRLRR
jgi:hypothetical protein